ncbi:hypothetical protein KQX54_006319 [Cotesia glomerata]|uniref:Uncharacterized protein n=1 Tax=Cotesia glomerata TaxID=32391 RepID=A0AAV7HV61_COTGL|nr:hypothetical protein KQX54_006319 [Cotesia glomerata]
MKSTRQMSHEVNPADIIPGSVLNIEELLGSESRNISVKNVLIEKNNYATAPFVASNYENCFKKNQKGGLNFEAGEYNYFEERMRIQNYGVDQEYATENFTCSKIIICSELRKQDLYFPPLKIVKLNEKSKDNMKNNVFENETIMLLFADRNETHYVLIYPVELSYFTDNSGIEVKTIHKSRILSATNNDTLERWAETVTQNDLKSICYV